MSPEKTDAAPKAEAKEQKPEVEKQTNCLGCNKPLKKIKVYYRDGKYYCDKKCWVKALKPKDENKEVKK